VLEFRGNIRRPHNEHFTLKTNPLRREDLDDFVTCYHAEADGDKFYHSCANEDILISASCRGVQKLSQSATYSDPPVER
jgi:type I restriction-modification system DNA methylase subunit